MIELKNDDIDEIIFHIKKLKKHSTKKDKTKETSITKDDIKSKISNNKDSIKNDQLEPITVMNPKIIGFTDESKVTCDVCDTEIILGKNLSGLVVDNEFFACENCCISLSKEDLMDWTKSKMVSSNDVRPIGLWVIQQQGNNKD